LTYNWAHFITTLLKPSHLVDTNPLIYIMLQASNVNLLYSCRRTFQGHVNSRIPNIKNKEIDGSEECSPKA